MSAKDTQIGGGHYKNFPIQPAEFVHRNGIGYLEGSALYYIVRHKDKGGKQDLEKAIHTIQLIIEMDYPDENEAQTARANAAQGDTASIRYAGPIGGLWSEFPATIPIHGTADAGPSLSEASARDWLHARLPG